MFENCQKVQLHYGAKLFLTINAIAYTRSDKVVKIQQKWDGQTHCNKKGFVPKFREKDQQKGLHNQEE